jgi:hypothetical protein
MASGAGHKIYAHAGVSLKNWWQAVAVRPAPNSGHFLENGALPLAQAEQVAAWRRAKRAVSATYFHGPRALWSNQHLATFFRRVRLEKRTIRHDSQQYYSI